MPANINIDLYEGEAITNVNMTQASALELLQLINTLAVLQKRISEQLAEGLGVEVDVKNV